MKALVDPCYQSVVLWLAETRFLLISFVSCHFFGFHRVWFFFSIYYFFVPARYHKALCCLFLTSSHALPFQQQAVNTLFFSFLLTISSSTSHTHTNMHTLKHAHGHCPHVWPCESVCVDGVCSSLLWQARVWGGGPRRPVILRTPHPSESTNLLLLLPLQVLQSPVLLLWHRAQPNPQNR